MSIAPRTIENVKACLSEAAKTGADVSMARLMSKHGNLTPEAKAYAVRYSQKSA